MKRYSIDRIYKNAELELQHACMELRDDGEWVKYEDVAVEIERLTARLAEHEAAWDAAKEAIEILREGHPAPRSPGIVDDTEDFSMCLQQIEWKRPGAEGAA